MPRKTPGLGLTANEIAAAFAHDDWQRRYPPLLTVDQAAELLQVPKKTLYDWSSRRLLTRCSRRVGRHLRFFRDRLIDVIFN